MNYVLPKVPARSQIVWGAAIRCAGRPDVFPRGGPLSVTAGGEPGTAHVRDPRVRGRTRGAVLAVASVDTPWRIHLDLNLGPVALGRGGSPLRWFHSLSAAIGAGRYGFTGEAYGYSAGAGEAAQWGALGAVTVRLAQWAVVDAGGSVGLWRDTPDLAFVGLTTNIGRVFR